MTVVRLSRQMMLGFAALLGVPWACLGILAYTETRDVPAVAVAHAAEVPPVATVTAATAPATLPTTGPTPASPLTMSKPGPWGVMQYVPIALEMPEDYLPVERTAAIRDSWNFAGMNRAAALAFLAECGLTSEQLAMAQSDAWLDAGTSASLLPSDALVLSIAPEARAKLYARLILDPVNKYVIDPTFFRNGWVDFRLRGSELSDASMGVLRALLYPGPDDTMLFNDAKVALRAIPDPVEQMRFMKAVTRKRSLMARVVIDADTDTNALAAYWGAGGRVNDVLPVLDSMKFNAVAGVESPSKINITSLLPSFVQERLYRHSQATQPTDTRPPEDCFWTAFNFFSRVPDDNIHDVRYLSALIQRDYVKVDAPSQLGDVILIGDANSSALHAANYIADDIVFTKNGGSHRQPWILMPLRDMLSTYEIANGTLTISYFRKR